MSVPRPSDASVDKIVIRVDSSYYMVCSGFANMGMPILQSRDMVNWIISAQNATIDQLESYVSGR